MSPIVSCRSFFVFRLCKLFNVDASDTTVVLCSSASILLHCSNFRDLMICRVSSVLKWNEDKIVA